MLKHTKFFIFFISFAFVVIKNDAQVLPDLVSIPVDLIVPSMTTENPNKGVRVKQTTKGWENTEVYHALYLPKNWKPKKKYPLILEFAGNGNYKNKYGDSCDGSVQGSNMGYGLSEGKDFIWVCMPFIEVKNGTKRNCIKWWGDIEETKRYIFATLQSLSINYGVDTNCVILAGFSRGALACNYLGLYDDEIATKWSAFFCHSHYDGVLVNWHYPFADKESAVSRLKRLNGRPQWISQEGSTKGTQKYIDSIGVKGSFTFTSIPFRNHSDQWLLRNINETIAAREWLHRVVAKYGY